MGCFQGGFQNGWIRQITVKCQHRLDTRFQRLKNLLEGLAAGAPGQIGQASLAAESHTVMTPWIPGAPASANTSQLFELKPSIGRP